MAVFPVLLFYLKNICMCYPPGRLLPAIADRLSELCNCECLVIARKDEFPSPSRKNMGDHLEILYDTKLSSKTK